MKRCVFCQIAKTPKSESHRIIYSDDKYIGMRVLNPESEGHFILFPKKHFSEIKDVINKGKYFELVIRLAEKFTKKLGAKAYFIKMNNNVYKLENDPMHVGHVHIHVVPRYNKAVE